MEQNQFAATVDDSPSDTPVEVVADLLADRTRRAALACLATVDEPVAISDLARDVARRCTSEGEAAGGGAPSDGDHPTDVREHARELSIRLYHDHLPRLADHDLVALDCDRNAVRLREEGEAIASKLTIDQ